MKIERLIFVFTVLVIVLNLSVLAQDEKVTMYAPDGRTVSVVPSAVEEYKAVGWYVDKEEVMITVYAADGRTRRIFVGQKDAYQAVGWYEDVADVTAVMYREDGTSDTFFKAYIQDRKKEGWYENKEDVLVTMYAVDGRSKTVYKSNVEEEKKVGWYTEPVTYVYALDGRRLIIKKSAVADYKKVGWYENEEDIYQYVYSLSDKRYVMKSKAAQWINVGWSESPYPISIEGHFSKTSGENSCIDLYFSVRNTGVNYKAISKITFDAYYYDMDGKAVKDIYGKTYKSAVYDCQPLNWYSKGEAFTPYFTNITGCNRIKLCNIKLVYADGTSTAVSGAAYLYEKNK